ncbi:MAG: recombination regulator RecX [Candidatus Omnitrophica bacterium]|nr:recombination regulator RecX [Candidatus Omnitrophota bacterium]
MKNQNSQAIFEKAKRCAFLLLKFRLRTEQELVSRMKQKKYPAEIISRTIDFLKEKKFINDEIFTRAWIDSRLKRSMGMRRVKNELKLKGVPGAIIDRSIGEAKENYSEDETVADLIKHKMHSMKDIDPRKAKERLYAFLLRRGFSSEAIMDNLNRAIKDES